VKTFEQLTIQFHAATHDEVLDRTDLPDEMIGKLQGEVISTKRAAQLADCRGLPPTVEQSSRKLLQQSQSVDERQTRVLFQNLTVDRVPVHEVHYTYAGVPRRLWIYGDGHVHAPGAPWRRDRLLAILAAIAGAMIVVALAFFLLRS
jgi:hypothetical protein